MLEEISDKFGPFKQLYFMQDSIHVMVAYAAIFLIKVNLICYFIFDIDILMESSF